MIILHFHIYMDLQWTNYLESNDSIRKVSYRRNIENTIVLYKIEFLYFIPISFKLDHSTFYKNAYRFQIAIWCKQIFCNLIFSLKSWSISSTLWDSNYMILN